MSKNSNKSSAARTQSSSKGAQKPPTSKAPATIGTKGAAVKPASDITIEDEDDDDEDGDETIEVGGVKVRASQKVRMLARIGQTRGAITRFVEKAAATPTLASAVNNVLEALNKLNDVADALPDDWKRARSARINKSFNSGDSVKVSEARRSKYEGLIDADEMDELTVIKQQGNNVSVRTASGGKMFLPAWHLVKA